MAIPQSVKQWPGKTAITPVIVGLGAESANAVWPTVEIITMLEEKGSIRAIKTFGASPYRLSVKSIGSD